MSIMTKKGLVDDSEFFKESIESDQESVDVDFKEIILRNKKIIKSEMPIIEKSVTTNFVKKSVQAPKKQPEVSSSDDEKDKKEVINKIYTSTLAYKRNANNTSLNSSQNIPFKIDNSTLAPNYKKKSIFDKMSQKKDYDVFPISDDDTSNNEISSKSHALLKKESAYHETKINEFTKQMADSKLAEKKAKWLNLDDFKSDEEETESINYNIQKAPHQSKQITPFSRKKQTPKHDKRIVGSNEVNNNYKMEFGLSSNDDDIIEVNDTPQKIEFNRTTIDRDDKIEARLEKVKGLNKLTEQEIEYMVLRDINYYLGIFAGQCEHSWRHREFKKYSKKLGNHLYCSSLLASFSHDQYMSAVKALQSVFCKNHHKRDEYIVKVLLPEALIKICMRIHQCSKHVAESYLEKYNFTKPLEWNKFKSTLST